MTTQERLAILGHILKEHQSISSKSQQQRLALALTRSGSINTIEARHYLDVMHPSGRLKELREQGWLIDKITVRYVAECGSVHHIANYVLKSLPLGRAA
jgi:hypothetical protein